MAKYVFSVGDFAIEVQEWNSYLTHGDSVRKLDHADITCLEEGLALARAVLEAEDDKA